MFIRIRLKLHGMFVFIRYPRLLSSKSLTLLTWELRFLIFRLKEEFHLFWKFVSLTSAYELRTGSRVRITQKELQYFFVQNCLKWNQRDENNLQTPPPPNPRLNN